MSLIKYSPPHLFWAGNWISFTKVLQLMLKHRPTFQGSVMTTDPLRPWGLGHWIQYNSISMSVFTNIVWTTILFNINNTVCVCEILWTWMCSWSGIQWPMQQKVLMTSILNNIVHKYCEHVLFLKQGSDSFWQHLQINKQILYSDQWTETRFFLSFYR